MRGFCPYCCNKHLIPHDTNSYYCTTCECIFVIERDEVISKFYRIDEHGRRVWNCNRHKMDSTLWKGMIGHLRKKQII